MQHRTEIEAESYIDSTCSAEEREGAITFESLKLRLDGTQRLWEEKQKKIEELRDGIEKYRFPDHLNKTIPRLKMEYVSLSKAVEALLKGIEVDDVIISEKVKDEEVYPNYKNLPLNLCIDALTYSANFDWVYTDGTVYLIGKAEDTFPPGSEHAFSEVRRLNDAIDATRRAPLK